MYALFIVGRILFGGFFLVSAWSHFKNLENMSGYAKSKGVPAPKLAVVLSGLLFLLGGLSIIFGFRPDLGLGAIIITLIPITFMMHPFWKEAGDAAQKGNDRIHFMKNAALIGACLIILATF
jgi:putative oxidoreductase